MLRLLGIKRTTLVSYSLCKLQALNSDGLDYKLTVETTWLWGLIRFRKPVFMTIPAWSKTTDYTELWNDLIKTKKGIRA